MFEIILCIDRVAHAELFFIGGLIGEYYALNLYSNRLPAGSPTRVYDPVIIAIIGFIIGATLYPIMIASLPLIIIREFLPVH